MFWIRAQQSLSIYAHLARPAQPTGRQRYWTVLHCSVLYYTVLHCSVLYYTVPYCTILFHFVLYYTVLYCSILFYTVLHCSVLYCNVPYCTTIYNIVLYYTVLYYTVLRSRNSVKSFRGNQMPKSTLSTTTTRWALRLDNFPQ